MLRRFCGSNPVKINHSVPLVSGGPDSVISRTFCAIKYHGLQKNAQQSQGSRQPHISNSDSLLENECLPWYHRFALGGQIRHFPPPESASPRCDLLPSERDCTGCEVISTPQRLLLSPRAAFRCNRWEEASRLLHCLAEKSHLSPHVQWTNMRSRNRSRLPHRHRREGNEPAWTPRGSLAQSAQERQRQRPCALPNAGALSHKCGRIAPLHRQARPTALPGDARGAGI
jgi:hypothetical protein